MSPQNMCHTDLKGRENGYCQPCLVGERWDALRAELGTDQVRGFRRTVPTVKYSEWMSQTVMASAFRIILKVSPNTPLYRASCPPVSALQNRACAESVCAECGDPWRARPVVLTCHAAYGRWLARAQELLGYEVVKTVTTAGTTTFEQAASPDCQAINLEVSAHARVLRPAPLHVDSDLLPIPAASVACCWRSRRKHVLPICSPSVLRRAECSRCRHEQRTPSAIAAQQSHLGTMALVLPCHGRCHSQPVTHNDGPARACLD